MNIVHRTGLSCVLGALFALPLACTVDTQPSESLDSASEAVNPGHCQRATPKDSLIAELVKHSWLSGYPLTRLSVDASGLITGVGLPDVVAGDLEVINSVTEARESVARALVKVSGLPDYEIISMGPDSPACEGIPAWSPTGTTTVNTVANEFVAGPLNYDSWRKTHMEFGKECPLVKRLANKDIVDPPGDGSTNAPVSATVSASGVSANAFGICPTGSTSGTYCKLSYATGVNYTGRTCQVYYGSLRCLLY